MWHEVNTFTDIKILNLLYGNAAYKNKIPRTGHRIVSATNYQLKNAYLMGRKLLLCRLQSKKKGN